MQRRNHTLTPQYLKYYIKIEENSTFYISLKQTKPINKTQNG